jgi:DNA polymerase
MDGRTARAVKQRLESLAEAGVTALPKAGGTVAIAAVTPPAPTAGRAGDGDAARSLAILRQEVADCMRCVELAGTRTQTVFGAGPPDARLCFFGEAPGADEDASGVPFVGRAGQLLTKIIEACKLSRDDVYIMNVLKCRPPDNRAPLPDEVANCRPFFERQLEIIRPEFICCLGASAARALLQTEEPIGRLRGRWFTSGPARVICTYHPSYLLRHPAAKRDVWDDMKLLMAALGIPL